MICARRTSPAPSFCERVIRASLCASSSLNPRTRSVIATSPAWTRAPCNAPDPEKSYPTCRMHHLDGAMELAHLAQEDCAHRQHRTRILIVSDVLLYREGLTASLTGQPGLEVISPVSGSGA